MVKEREIWLTTTTKIGAAQEHVTLEAIGKKFTYKKIHTITNSKACNIQT